MLRQLLISVILLVAITGEGQVQFNGITSVLKGSGYYDNHAMLLGGGMAMKYMINEQFFVGVQARTYKASTTAYERYNAQDRLSNFSGSVDMVMRKRKLVQPYLGLAVGVSTPTHMINYIRNYQKFTMYSLKGGVHIAIGKSTGFFSELEYNYAPGDGGPSRVADITNPVLTEPISKFITLDCGLYIRLYMQK